MKHFSILILIISVLVSCKPEAEKSCLVSGTFSNTTDKEIKLTIGTRVDTLKLNADGTFSKEISVDKPVEAMLQGTKLYASLYLIPGGDLAVTADGSDFNKGLSYSGSLLPENGYLLKKQEGEKAFYDILNAAYRAPNTPADFKRIRDSMRLADENFLQNYSSPDRKLKQEFVDHQKKVIQFSYLGDMLNYPTMAGYFNTDKPEIPADWNAVADGVELDDPALLDISEAKYFISQYITAQAMKTTGVSRENAYNNAEIRKATFAYLLEHFKNPEFFNQFAFESLKGTIDSQGTNGLQEQIDEYLAKSTDEANKKTLREMVGLWASMAAGQPAPVFNLPDINGKMVSMTEFAGKYIFIDFWATWCGPCKAEIPAYKQLISDYAGKNIVFISISVDKDKAAWEKMVKEGIPNPANESEMIQMTWLQLHDAVKYNKIWLVKFIPTFVLIDPQGKIVNARAERPSKADLRTVLDGLAGI